MKIFLIGLSAEQRSRVEAVLMATIRPYTNGEGVAFVYPPPVVSEAASVRVEGAKLIASTRLESMLREDLARIATS